MHIHANYMSHAQYCFFYDRERGVKCTRELASSTAMVRQHICQGKMLYHLDGLEWDVTHAYRVSQIQRATARRISHPNLEGDGESPT
jgi:hypothetical protein